MKYNKKLTAAIIITSALSLYGCGDGESTIDTSTTSTQKLTPVTAYKAELGSVPLKIATAGEVFSEQKATISSRIVGYINNIPVSEGEEIKKGEPLFSIDSNDIRSGIQKAESAFETAKASLQDAKIEFERFKTLYSNASSTKQQYDKAALRLKTEQQKYEFSKTQLEQANHQLKYANVTAPFDGIVVKKLASVGDLSTPGNPVLIIENKSSINVKTKVPQELYNNLKLGDTAMITIDGKDRDIQGKIYTLVSSADPRSRTHVVKLSVDNKEHINSGTYAKVLFSYKDRKSIIIPKTALIERSGITGVFVSEDGIARFNMVTLGNSLGKNVEIKSGLFENDLVIVENNNELLNGEKLEISNINNLEAE